MEKLIQAAGELKQYFFEVRKSEKALEKGLFVTSKIRMDILTSIDQGKIILEGRVKTIEFKNLTGGVYRAFVEKE